MERRAAMSWAQRLKRAFNIDIETRGECGGAVRMIACIEDSEVIEKILTHLDAKGGAPEATEQQISASIRGNQEPMIARTCSITFGH